MHHNRWQKPECRQYGLIKANRFSWTGILFILMIMFSHRTLRLCTVAPAFYYLLCIVHCSFCCGLRNLGLVLIVATMQCMHTGWCPLLANPLGDCVDWHTLSNSLGTSRPDIVSWIFELISFSYLLSLLTSYTLLLIRIDIIVLTIPHCHCKPCLRLCQTR